MGRASNISGLNKHISDIGSEVTQREREPSRVENALMTKVKVDGNRNGWSCAIANKSCQKNHHTSPTVVINVSFVPLRKKESSPYVFPY